MKNNSIFLIVIAVLIVIFHEFILATGYICYISAKYLIVSGIPETFNRVVYIKDNNDAYNNYIYERYGVISKTFKMHTDGRFYSVSAPFIEKEFSIQIHKGNIETDNFYKVLSTDPKFQHLYSECVKKQVGIEDENVELYFNRAMCGSRVIGDKPYIDFNKITSYENLEEQICKNTHNLYIRSNHFDQGVDIKVKNIENVKEALNYADLVEEKIRTRIFMDTNHFGTTESNHLFICFLTKNGENILDIKYNYDSNTKMYRYHNKDSKWIEYE